MEPNVDLLKKPIATGRAGTQGSITPNYMSKAICKKTPMALATRPFLSRRDTIRTRAQATAGDETLESDSYYASLIRLPDEFCPGIDHGAKSFGRSQEYLATTIVQENRQPFHPFKTTTVKQDTTRFQISPVSKWRHKKFCRTARPSVLFFILVIP